MPRRMYLTTRHTVAVAAGVAVLLLVLSQRHRKAALSDSNESAGGPPAQQPPLLGLRKMIAPLSRAAASDALQLKDGPRGALLAAPASFVTGVPRADRALVPSDASIAGAVDVSHMIVRNGGASIEVLSIDSVMPRVRALAAQVGGFVTNSAISGGREQARTATLEIKAPAQTFDELVHGLEPLGKVESVNVSAEDVGEEYVDVEARMDNDHRLEARLIELLATRTGKLKDVLDVEQQLARVREEIERYEGRLRYLHAHAELSTLTITVHEPIPIINHVGTNPIIIAARQAWYNFVALVAFVVASLGVVVPVAAVGGAAWLLFRRPAAAVKPASGR